jgi:hypothetical protein
MRLQTLPAIPGPAEASELCLNPLHSGFVCQERSFAL